MSWIYVIGITDNPVKVGMANSLEKRLMTLQIGCPDLLIIHHSVRVPSRSMATIERLAHQKLREHHRRGEWFNVSASVAAVAVDDAAAIVDSQERPIRWRGIDEIDRIAVHHTLAENVREALAHYRDAQRADTDVAREIENFVFKRCGTGALEALRHIAAQQQFGPTAATRYPRIYGHMMDLAGKALNAVSDLHAFRSEQALLDEISRNAA